MNHTLALVASFGMVVAAVPAAHADDTPAAVAPLDQPPPADEVERMQRSRFSGTRLLAEILIGGVVGSVAAYATFTAMCDGENCMGAALTAFVVDFAVTPLATWQVGKRLGGRGSLKMSYLGGVVALGAFSAPGAPDETPDETLTRIGIAFAVSTICLPITSAVFYELSSQMRFARWKQATENGTLSVAVTPTFGRAGVDGAIAQLGLGF